MIGIDVLYLGVAELAARIKARQLSSVELTQAYLDRSKKFGGALNAYATLTPDLALQQARAADAEIKAGKYRGPLHGIPYAAKDLLAVKGYPTTWGAKPYANQRFDYDATVIQRLTDAGAVLIGKAAMIELAGGMGYRFASASATGPAKNPWNATCWTCGSSSGSGAIVAASLAAFAIGTETWGSIVCPSSFCGISGLRPTYGIVSRHGAMALSYSMDKIGPMCRSAEDCGLVIKTIAGYDLQDPASRPSPNAPAKAVRGLRIGWLAKQWSKPDPEILKLATDAVNVLKNSGAQVQDALLPEGPWEAAAGTIISVEGASAFEKLITSGGTLELNDPAGQIGGMVSETIGGADFLKAMRVRAMLMKKMDELFTKYDVLACATLPAVSTPLDANLDDALSFSDPIGGIGNACGLPALSVPCGFTSKKLPAGFLLVGPHFSEATLVAAMNTFQQQTNFHKQRPPETWAA
jgi:aspartyl-tRNA(Asn)/glutamyl-tRNA(Gln) amidotransferase subunit A